ncbi:MAG: hypothetical protein GY778_26820 [bacterium]|nr:hypothetical protein [bacterium]
MMLTKRALGETVRAAVSVVVVLGLPLLLAGGCAGTSGTSESGSNGSSGEPTSPLREGEDSAEPARVIGLTTDLAVSGSQMVTVPYYVPSGSTNVRAFYALEGNESDPTQRTFLDFGTSLSTGSSQFNIDTGILRRGNYIVGISYINGSTGETEAAYSTGVLRVQGLPVPGVIEPTEDLEIVTGAVVRLIADMGDPEADVAWRAFFIADDKAPEVDKIVPSEVGLLGNELAAGTGNVANIEWSTESVALGTYLLGVSATDTGFSVAATASGPAADQIVTVYAAGRVTIIGEEPVAKPPEVTVTGPGADVATYLTETVNISFSAETFEGDADGVVVFWDTNLVFDAETDLADERIIADGLTTEDTDAQISTAALAEGDYYVGVVVDDGLNKPVVAYAPGKLTVVKTPTLEVLTPSLGDVIRPSETTVINWSTNVPGPAINDGRVVREVYLQADIDNDGSPDGEKIVLDVPEGSATSVEWTPIGRVGKFLAFVSLSFPGDESVSDLLKQAPGFIRVSTAPQIIWTGGFADIPAVGEPAGTIFEAHQFEDNLGSAFTRVGDQNGDGNDDFVMVARYGKPDFFNQEGIGHGEAYLIHTPRPRLGGVQNVNSVGTGALPGVTFVGIRTRQGNTETWGISDVSGIPDVDGDGKDELVFGFPKVESRGHNIDPDQDGVRPPENLGSLERPGQFLRGGVVIVSSTNSVIGNPDAGSPVIKLDMVGQDFDLSCVLYEPGEEDDFVLDIFQMDDETFSCFGTDGFPVGSCFDHQTDTNPDATNMNWGFVAALAEDYFTAMRGTGCLIEYDYHLNNCFVLYPDNVVRRMTDYCNSVGPGCQPTSPALHLFPGVHPDTTLFGFGYSGYYPDTWDSDQDEDPGSLSEEDIVDNEPREPYGARIIGVGLEDEFGTSITLSTALEGGGTDLIVSAPGRTARGILLQERSVWDPSWPETGGEISGLERPAGTAAINNESGVAYLFDLRSLWTEDSFGRVPPKPHQYIVGEPSHCGGAPGKPPRIENITATRIAGATNENITNTVGIRDFNGDGRNDFAVGAPTSDRVYIAFRRDEAIEGDFVLEKLELANDNPERLNGALINGSAGSNFAFSMGTDVDFNGDGEPDLVVGAPGANGDTGEVAIIFASPQLITGAGGIDIDELIKQGRAAKISGGEPGDLFGFNIAAGGDIDGDGKDDLLIAAPGASPQYDADPFDNDDTLNAPGLDVDGVPGQDDVTGASEGSYGIPDGTVDAEDNLANAGLVYIIWGSNEITDDVSITELGANALEGAIVVGRRGGDFLGGGDAGDGTFGGITAKKDRGRSYGLAAAGDVDGDGLDDFLIGSVMATPRIDPETGEGVTHGGEAYLVYGFRR